MQTLSACKIVSFKGRRFKLWNPVFRMVNIITKQKQFSLHRHFKKIYGAFFQMVLKRLLGRLQSYICYAFKSKFNVHQTKKAFGKGTFAYGFKRHRSQDLRPALNGNVGSEKLMHALLTS